MIGMSKRNTIGPEYKGLRCEGTDYPFVLTTDTLYAITTNGLKNKLQTTISAFNIAKSQQSIYENSNWVIFINLEVDINFFYKQNLYVVHYTDQYTINAKYDSITVTKHVDQYEIMLRKSYEEFVLSEMFFPKRKYYIGFGKNSTLVKFIYREGLENLSSPVCQDNGLYSITNLGALLFAKDLNEFARLGRKAMRVVQYKGINRLLIQKEETFVQGYAVCFENIVRYVNALLPSNEDVNAVQLSTTTKFPLPSVREAIANAILCKHLHKMAYVKSCIM